MSGVFVQFNRNKRSVAIDLKEEAGRDAFLTLGRDADIVVENFRPGVSDRLGVGFEVARRENPGLIWVAITGFSPSGPYASQPAYDMVIQGMSGFAKLLGDEERFAPETYGGPPRDPRLEEGIYRAWKTADGHVAFLVIEDRQFQGLAKAIEPEDLVSDPRFEAIAGRIGNAGELFDILEAERS